MSLRHSKKSLVNDFQKESSSIPTSSSQNELRSSDKEKTEIAVTLEDFGPMKLTKDDDENLEESDEEFNIEIDSMVISNNREEMIPTKD